jgi:RNA-directed DNA polymerase
LRSTKPFTIAKSLVVQAWREVKSNAGSSGIDGETLAKFEVNLKNNLYKIWNRMSSGSYFPPPVRSVSIPKKDGSERILGIPTVSDRIAQTVAKLIFENQVEPCFYEDSYGYRPNVSALDAVGITRKRCWKLDWVLEFDIKGLFDNIDHDLLMKAVKHHCKEQWIILYIERWLKAPMQDSSGELIERSKGTPQGGVISPVLANLFLHYAFDHWISKSHPKSPWCRYADDGLIHCKTEVEALMLLSKLKRRFAKCGLELHPKKTKIVYCKDDKRRNDYPITHFDFLGYEFRGRVVRNRKLNTKFFGFTPSVSRQSLKSMGQKLKGICVYKYCNKEIEYLAQKINPILIGWMNYYGAYNKSALYALFRKVNHKIILWIRRKYKKTRGSRARAMRHLNKIYQHCPSLFAHWRTGVVGRFA